MGNKIFTFNFDINIVQKLRDAVNSKQNISLDKENELSNNGSKYLAWDRMCAIMDRLDDTLGYINGMELGKCRSTRSAFDFYEFINNIYIVIDCIKTMANIFFVDKTNIDGIENSQECFGDVLNVGGTDSKFFTYIRSLCAVHPINTTGRGRNKHPYMKDDVLHCCPFVIWEGNYTAPFRKDNRDLSVRIYNSKPGGNLNDLPLWVIQFEKYVNKWIDFIPVIIDAIHNYNAKVYENFRNEPIKKLEEYKNPTECLSVLNLQYEKRFGDYAEDIFYDYYRIFQFTLTNEENMKKLEKYKNAILYSIPFLINSLQNMDQTEYENTGVKYTDPCMETDLFSLLNYCYDFNGEFKNYHYNLSKLEYLEEGHSWFDRDYARKLLEEIKPLINKYVYFTNEERDEEVIILVNLALYFSSLETKCLLNKNIPNEEKYRLRILTNNEYKKLLKEDKKKTKKTPDKIILEFVDAHGNITDTQTIDISGNISKE